MNSSIMNLILCFFLFSFLGWIIETVFKSIRDRQFINSGFLSGPFVPIYGFGAVLIIHSSRMIDPMMAPLDAGAGFALKLILTIFLACLLEYCTGALLEAVFHQQWWDYSDERFHIKGRVSLTYSVAWGALSYLVLQFIYPVISQILSNTPVQVKQHAIVLLLVYLTVDTAGRLISLLDLQQYITWWKKFHVDFNLKPLLAKSNIESEYQDYAAIIDDLTYHPLVQLMKQFRHHNQVSCFDHSLHVSVTSFLLCRTLGWDSKAAARGGMLHDLFLYDWRTTTLEEGKHGFVHPQIALDNALSEFALTDVEKDIIVKHMFPLTWPPPYYKESLLVCLVDKYCALQEVLGLSKQISAYINSN